MQISPMDAEVLARYEFFNQVPAHGLVDDEGSPYLTRIKPQEVAPYVIVMVRDALCGYDVSPVAEISQHLSSVRRVGNSGMFETITGNYKGVSISVIVGGSGGPELELALMDFIEHTPAHTFVRVGGSGGMSQLVSPGDIVITHGCVRDEGLTEAYVPRSFPACADIDVVLAMRKAAQALGVSYHVGITRSTDSDFVQSGRPAAGGFLPVQQLDTLRMWSRSGVLNGDRETAALLVLCSLYGKRAGSVCSVADNIVSGQSFVLGGGHTEAIEVALNGIVILAEEDREN